MDADTELLVRLERVERKLNVLVNRADDSLMAARIEERAEPVLYGVQFVAWDGRSLNRAVWTVTGDADGFVLGDRVRVRNTKYGDRRAIVVRVGQPGDDDWRGPYTQAEYGWEE